MIPCSKHLIAGLAVVGCLALAPVAGASTITYNGTVLTYTAATGEHNSGQSIVTPYPELCQLGRQEPCLSLSDSARIDFPADRCRRAYRDVFQDQVYCQMPTAIVASLGDGDDSWWEDTELPSTIDAGAGNDNPIYGKGGDDLLQGGIGSDLLVGGPGNDTLDGGPGDDYLEGIIKEGPQATAGADTYVGGGGLDSVNYGDRTEDLSLSIDGVANDGAAGEGDNLGLDITGVQSGAGNDTITGSAQRNTLAGGDGNDTIAGGDGDDALDGWVGNDRVDGGAGQDSIGGGDGDDVLVGGADRDIFWGEEPNSGCGPVLCETGRDQVFARDGIAEPIDCGPGTDAVQGDAVDVVFWGSCEQLDIAGAPPGGGGQPGGGQPGGGQPGIPNGGRPAGGGGPALGVQNAAAVDRRGRIALRLTAPGAGRLDVQAALRNGRRTIPVGRAALTVKKAGAVTVQVPASAAARKALKARRKLPVVVVVRFTPAAGGKPLTKTQNVLVRAAR
jgi:hypothetical protein